MESFVNREFELRQIDDAFEALRDTESLLRTPILDFYGVEGIGKATIWKQGERRCHDIQLPSVWSGSGRETLNILPKRIYQRNIDQEIDIIYSEENKILQNNRELMPYADIHNPYLNGVIEPLEGNEWGFLPLFPYKKVNETRSQKVDAGITIPVSTLSTSSDAELQVRKEIEGNMLLSMENKILVETSSVIKIHVYTSYAFNDRKMHNEFKKHLKRVTVSGVELILLDEQISPGLVWEEEIKKLLDTAEVIIFLLSADSLDLLDVVTCNSLEMSRALERHERNESRIIPVILRQCLWQNTLFNKLQVLPRNCKPVGHWNHRDEAYKEVAIEIQHMIEKLVKSV